MRELGVGHLVAPGAERRGALHAHEEVGVAAPGRRQHDSLVDDVHPAAHRVERSLGGGPEPVGRAAVELDLLHLEAGLAQPFQVRSLVLVALPGHEVGRLVARQVAPEAPVRALALQVGQMPALGEAHEVAGREEELSVERGERSRGGRGAAGRRRADGVAPRRAPPAAGRGARGDRVDDRRPLRARHAGALRLGGRGRRRDQGQGAGAVGVQDRPDRRVGAGRALAARAGAGDLAARLPRPPERERARWRLHLVKHRTMLKHRVHAS